MESYCSHASMGVMIIIWIDLRSDDLQQPKTCFWCTVVSIAAGKPFSPYSCNCACYNEAQRVNITGRIFQNIAGFQKLFTFLSD
jgi:hypothetical protein